MTTRSNGTVPSTLSLGTLDGIFSCGGRGFVLVSEGKRCWCVQDSGFFKVILPVFARQKEILHSSGRSVPWWRGGFLTMLDPLLAKEQVTLNPLGMASPVTVMDLNIGK